ncbi:MAG: hypothetical protein ACYC9L_03530 [Sulfuricaulis sp.]
MNPDIQSAARRLHEQIQAPRGVVGVLAWQDLAQPRIRVFVAPGSWHQIASIPAEFEGFPVEMVMGGDIMPFYYRWTKTAAISDFPIQTKTFDCQNYCPNLLRLSFLLSF